MLGTHARPTIRRGFTLMEMIVAMAVGSVALLVALEVYSQTERVLSHQRDAASRLGNGTDLLSLLRREVRAASEVGGASDDATLVLVALDGSETVYESGESEVTRRGPESPVAMAIGSVPVHARFEYPDAGLVRVSWGSERAARSVTLHLRNHES